MHHFQSCTYGWWFSPKWLTVGFRVHYIERINNVLVTEPSPVWTITSLCYSSLILFVFTSFRTLCIRRRDIYFSTTVFMCALYCPLCLGVALHICWNSSGKLRLNKIHEINLVLKSTSHPTYPPTCLPTCLPTHLPAYPPTDLPTFLLWTTWW